VPPKLGAAQILNQGSHVLTLNFYVPKDIKKNQVSLTGSILFAHRVP